MEVLHGLFKKSIANIISCRELRGPGSGSWYIQRFTKNIDPYFVIGNN